MVALCQSGYKESGYQRQTDDRPRYEEMLLFNSIRLQTLTDMITALYFTVVFIYMYFHIYCTWLQSVS